MWSIGEWCKLDNGATFQFEFLLGQLFHLLAGHFFLLTNVQEKLAEGLLDVDITLGRGLYVGNVPEGGLLLRQLLINGNVRFEVGLIADEKYGTTCFALKGFENLLAREKVCSVGFSEECLPASYRNLSTAGKVP